MKISDINELTSADISKIILSDMKPLIINIVPIFVFILAYASDTFHEYSGIFSLIALVIAIVYFVYMMKNH